MESGLERSRRVWEGWASSSLNFFSSGLTLVNSSMLFICIPNRATFSLSLPFSLPPFLSPSLSLSLPFSLPPPPSPPFSLPYESRFTRLSALFSFHFFLYWLLPFGPVRVFPVLRSLSRLHTPTPAFWLPVLAKDC